MKGIILNIILMGGGTLLREEPSAPVCKHNKELNDSWKEVYYETNKNEQDSAMCTLCNSSRVCTGIWSNLPFWG